MAECIACEDTGMIIADNLRGEKPCLACSNGKFEAIVEENLKLRAIVEKYWEAKVAFDHCSDTLGHKYLIEADTLNHEYHTQEE